MAFGEIKISEFSGRILYYLYRLSETPIIHEFQMEFILFFKKSAGLKYTNVVHK
jgi:hypothetical protein